MIARVVVLTALLAGCGGATTAASARGAGAARPPPPPPHLADRDALARQTLRCTGTIDSSRALAEVHARRGATTDCYQRVLELDPSWRVEVRVDLVVERSGEVSWVCVGDVDRSDFAECMADALGDVRMPALTSGECALVGVPYGFHTETR